MAPWWNRQHQHPARHGYCSVVSVLDLLDLIQLIALLVVLIGVALSLPLGPALTVNGLLILGAAMIVEHRGER